MRKVFVQYSVTDEPMKYASSKYTGARRVFDMPGKLGVEEFVNWLKSNVAIPADAKRIKVVDSQSKKPK